MVGKRANPMARMWVSTGHTSTVQRPSLSGSRSNSTANARLFQPIVGLQSAKTAQLNIVATFAADTDEVIVQVQKAGQTKNLTYGWSDFQGPNNPGFTPGEYRLAAYTLGFEITAARVGLLSTATDNRADFSAVWSD